MSPASFALPSALYRLKRQIRQGVKRLRTKATAGIRNILRHVTPQKQSISLDTFLAFLEKLEHHATSHVYKTLKRDDLAALLHEARPLMHAFCHYHAQCRYPQASGRAVCASTLLHVASSFGALHFLESTHTATWRPAHKPRVLRHLITLLVTTARTLWSPVDIKTYQAIQRTPTTTSPLMLLELYGQIFRRALELRLPHVWVPLFHELRDAGVFVPSSEKMRTHGTVEEMTLDRMCAYVCYRPLCSITTLQRHMNLLEHTFPEVFQAFIEKSHGSSLKSRAVRTAVYTPLTYVKTEQAYDAWYRLWHQKGFTFNALENWISSRLPHSIPSPFACAYRHTPSFLNIASLPVPLLFSDKQRSLSLAGYVLPLLYEGEAFFTQSGLKLSDIHPVRVEGPGSPHVLASPSEIWSPWQHLAAYLVFGERYDEEETPLNATMLRACLCLCERAWGPPSVFQGTFDDFLTWYDRMREGGGRYQAFPFTLTAPQETVSIVKQEKAHLWQSYLDAHALTAQFASSEETLLTTPPATRRRL